MKKYSYCFIVLSLAAFFVLTFSSFVTASEPIYATKEPVEIYNPYYVGVFGAFVVPERMDLVKGSSDVNLDNSWALGVKGGYIFPSKWLAAEVEYTYLANQDVNKPGTGHFNANNIMANLLLRYPEGMIRPYIGAGLGWSFADCSSASDNNYGWQALAGINLEINPSVSVDFGYRYFSSDLTFNNVDTKAEDHILLAGLNYHFGGQKPVPPPPKEEPVPVVQEKIVKCPNTPAGCIVDKDGCPMDSDGDGVCDGLDKCPNTPKGCIVDKDGCPIDSDKDGVCDGLDKCPDTPEISKVDANGCPVMAVIRLYVQFEYKKSVVKPEFFNEIKKLGDFMKNHPNLNATIEGHTDNIAAADYNLKLSKERAEAVMKVLIEREKIDPKRLTAVGYGLTKPIASNDTEEGRAKNRRVEALLEGPELKK